MPETLIKVDLTKSAYDNDMVHNRWPVSYTHLTLPTILRV